MSRVRVQRPDPVQYRPLAVFALVVTTLVTANAVAAEPEQVPITADGGVYSVPARLNGVLRMDLVLDTGAAFVMIPADVALTLKRTGTLSTGEADEMQEFTLADGSVVEKRRVVLRSLQVGSRQLRDVEAIVGGLQSPLLLGQSALRRLEPWRIDTHGGRLILLKEPTREPGQPAPEAPAPRLTKG